MSAAQARNGRPAALHTSRSFTRMESPSSPSSPRKRASTIQVSGIASIPEARPIDHSPERSGKSPKKDVFEHEDDEHATPEPDTPAPELQLPSKMDELPIEIRSMTERFLDSLSAKVHPAPLNADTLSDMFQDFYERAASQIDVHIAALASKIGRRQETAPSKTGKGRARAGSNAKRTGSPASGSGGEMLTVSEVEDRKKARKLLELKRVALEEAVERNVCEKVYDRIYKHRTTDDDARDEKLRSRTAALAVVGIGLKELHMDHDPAKEQIRETAEEREEEINTLLAPAREALQRMDDEQYPLGKLQHLTAAHKTIVESLSQLFPSSSSADEILPTLIYTLITSPPEGINAVSNLNFVQRFRSQSKVDGEAAYCLVNLEAAISFLETVDLSSLRADEAPEGPPKSNSRPSTPTSAEKPAPLQPASKTKLNPEITSDAAISTDKSKPETNKPLASALPPSTAVPRPGLQHRRLSSMVQAQADRLEASRENFLNAADKMYDSINGTLENSMKSIFGRFKEQIPDSNSSLPKTLEEARQLVSPPPITTPEDEFPFNLPESGRSSPGLDPLSRPPSTNAENKMLELLGGRKTPSLRERSVDSTKSTTSSQKRVAFTSANAKPPPAPNKPTAEEPLQSAANFITGLNPLNRFNVPVPSFPMRFGRSVSASQPSTPAPVDTQAQGSSKQLGDIVESPAAAVNGAAKDETLEKVPSRADDNGESDLNAAEALAELRGIKPPRKRFLEVGSASELKIGEVEELLAEYRRLAKAIGEAIAT